jgi:8-oxo-dGTP pyrophosphatase MutT (NUDIX family)
MHRVSPWRVLSDRILVERRWLEVHEQRVELPNGHQIDEFHLIRGPDWAGVLPLTSDGNAILVRQYRHGVGRALLELPAGVIEPGESGRAAAERELREETGYVAESWHALQVMSTEPARHTTMAHFFVALGARPSGDASPDAGELITVEPHPVAELAALIDSGEILHGVHVAAVLLAARRGFLKLE